MGADDEQPVLAGAPGGPGIDAEYVRAQWELRAAAKVLQSNNARYKRHHYYIDDKNGATTIFFITILWNWAGANCCSPTTSPISAIFLEMKSPTPCR